MNNVKIIMTSHAKNLLCVDFAQSNWNIKQKIRILLSLCSQDATFPLRTANVIFGITLRPMALEQGCQTRFSSGANSGKFNLKRAGPM